jgi:hypothetical protein
MRRIAMQEECLKEQGQKPVSKKKNQNYHKSKKALDLKPAKIIKNKRLILSEMSRIHRH